ncbi:MAG: SPOR domain-containing protein [Rhizobiaceae bacterium]
MRQTFASTRTRVKLGRPAAFLFAIMLSLTGAAQAASSKHAAIVVDANTGKTLYSSSADSRRYPASLTKMMTLYLTFEALERGKIKKSTQVKFSAQAAAQPPTKLGIRAGNSISVETAIYSLITRSANDASLALAELLGGSEQGFARMMTAKARSLGMNGTVFRNPHGLPNTGQFTTARDMAKLGIALREHYPQYYDYFSVRSFKYGKQRIANHNKLLGRVEGVDGIKTGYTRASGFNLVSSVTDGRRKIVAVVMGGSSGASRDREMADLIKKYFSKASSRGGGDLVAKSASPELRDVTVAALPLPKHDAPTPDSRPFEDDLAEVAEGDTEETAEGTDEYTIASVGVRIDAPATERFGQTPDPKPSRSTKPETTSLAPIKRPKVEVDPISTASTAPASGWSIQIAAALTEGDAKSALASVANRAERVVADASPYTMAFDKGGTTYYRARFGGFSSQAAATSACRQLKRQKIACYATQ